MTPEEPEQPNPETQPGFTSPAPEPAERAAESPPSEDVPTDFSEVHPTSSGEISLDDRNTAMLAHIGTLIGLFTVIGGFLVPLIIFLLKKDEGPDAAFVAGEAKESLNFQITLWITSIGISILGTVTCGVGFILLIPLVILAVVMPIIAGIKAKEGISYQYPLTLRLVS